MSIKTNLEGRVRNTSLPKSHALMPVFEAVVNSIQSIEDSPTTPKDCWIRILVHRSKDTESIEGHLLEDSEQIAPISGFTIEDNGVGFGEDKYAAFLTLDTDYRRPKGGHGIGRLLWLKAFDFIEIESLFQENNGRMKRSFSFSINDGVNSHSLEPAENSEILKTTLQLRDFKEDYRNACPALSAKIVDRLLEHILWYLVRENDCPRISLVDEEQEYHLNDQFVETIMPSIVQDKFVLKESEFSLVHAKLRNTTNSNHFVALCANGRVVESKIFGKGKILGLFGRGEDQKGQFVHATYVTSKYLDERVLSERLDFDIPKTLASPLLDNACISLDEIVNEVIVRVQSQMSVQIEQVRRESRKKIDDYSRQVSPRYKPIIKHLSDDDMLIDPSTNKKELELHLYKCLMRIEEQLIKEGQNVMSMRDRESQEEYKNRIKDYLAKVEDMKQSDLANYVTHRKVVIEILEIALKRGKDDRYSKESLLHELIIPQRKDSTQVESTDSNLWLVNERLAFHDYLASDISLKNQPITGSSSSERPDIDVLQVYDVPTLVSEKPNAPFGSLTVIEIKRPMAGAGSWRNRNPIKQVLQYLKKIRDGEVSTADGRPVTNPGNVPGYCYIISDITKDLREVCDEYDLTQTEDGMGFFGFHKRYNAYIEVLSYDRLLNGAKERNRAFFDKLGLPS